jgi:hypothetical protein
VRRRGRTERGAASPRSITQVRRRRDEIAEFFVEVIFTSSR